MFKKLREKIYNRRIEQELKEINSFQVFTNELYSIYPKFVGLTKDKKLVDFEPKTVYALKRAIQKLSDNYLKETSLEDFIKQINKTFIYAKSFDKGRAGECVDLFKSLKSNFNKESKEII